MLTIQEPFGQPGQHKTRWQAICHAPIFELAFRPFFLLATLFSCLALAVWLLQLSGTPVMPHHAIAPTLWHAHEMIFGFAITIAVAFILTAGQTWTNQASLSKGPLLGFVLLWCAIRATLYYNSDVSVILAIILSAIWWLMTIATFARMVIRANNKRNFLFVPILTVLAMLNLLVLTLSFQQQFSIVTSLMQISLLMMTLIMSIIGGRVIPFFTARGTNTGPIQTPVVIEKLVLIASICTIAFYILHIIFASLTPIMPWLFSLTALLHVARLAFWKSHQTLKVALLWSLHLSYLFMALGLLLLGFSYWLAAITFSMGIHTLTIGGIGLMILSMLSRVSLGHTGRALQVRPIIIAAFVLLVCSLIFRVALLTVISPYYAWLGSALCWLTAMAIFLWVYTPILTQKRADLAPPPPPKKAHS
ncbi:NnrS family protein [Thalassotalea fusca]